MPTKGKMTPGPWKAIGVGVYQAQEEEDGLEVFGIASTGLSRDMHENIANARAIACLPELIEAARMLCVNVDAMQLKPTIVSTAHLRRILARIDGEGA